MTRCSKCGQATQDKDRARGWARQSSQGQVYICDKCRDRVMDMLANLGFQREVLQLEFNFKPHDPES